MNTSREIAAKEKGIQKFMIMSKEGDRRLQMSGALPPGDRVSSRALGKISPQEEEFEFLVDTRVKKLVFAKFEGDAR